MSATVVDLLTAIESRASALKLMEPGPTRAHLEQIMRACMRAPDHGRLRPWRFVVLEGAAREKLGNEMARCGEQYRQLQLTSLARFFQQHGVEPQMSPPAVAFIMTALGSQKVMEQAVGISFAHGEIAALVDEKLQEFETALAKAAAPRRTSRTPRDAERSLKSGLNDRSK